MDAQQVVQSISMGSRVAEEEAADLAAYFVETENWRKVYQGEADVIFTSGGASAGDEDHVSALLRAEGTIASWRIAIKPGRPEIGRSRDVPLLGREIPGLRHSRQDRQGRQEHGTAAIPATRLRAVRLRQGVSNDRRHGSSW